MTSKFRVQPPYRNVIVATDASPLSGIAICGGSILAARTSAKLQGRVGCSLAATTGVHGPEEAIKLVLAGADVVMMASGLLKHGPDRLRQTVDGLRTWLEEREYQSLEQAKGSLSQKSVADPSAFERANYMRSLISYAPDW